MTNKLNNPPETLTSKDLNQLKVYTSKIDGVRYATVANWKRQGMMLKKGAQVSTLTTSNGFEVALYAQTQVEAYDFEAEAKEEAKAKAFKAETDAIYKEFRANKLTLKEYQQALANAVTNNIA